MKKIFLIFSVMFFVIFFSNVVLHTEVVTKPISLEDFQNSEAGTYPVLIKYTDANTGETIEKIVYMTVYYPNTIVNTEIGEYIDAMDVILTGEGSVVLGFSKEELIAKAKARAWSAADGAPIEIIDASVIRTGKIEKGEIYSVTFTTIKGTSNTVTFLETTQENLLVQNETYMDDFTNLNNQIRDWIYLSIAIFIFIPVLLMIISLGRMLNLVKRTRKLLYEEYNR